ncbi:hypothetical protein [Lacisediminihabitans changchengi]|uniref:Transposase n=1 Tax=Lacisediminihabitans changchengi TaxID=2787634 RepID=A0A934W397_9MICO|nr:hypothetical protein [Lacisediminihabitans changchengi]
MMYPLVVELADDRKITVAVTCRVLGLSKQSYFAWRADPVSRRDWDNAHLINAAIDIHGDEPGFGYRFIANEIEAEAGIAASEWRVWRLCSQQRTWSVCQSSNFDAKANYPRRFDGKSRPAPLSAPSHSAARVNSARLENRRYRRLTAESDAHAPNIVSSDLARAQKTQNAPEQARGRFDFDEYFLQ